MEAFNFTLMQFNVCNLIFLFTCTHVSCSLSLESSIILQERTRTKRIPVEAWGSWWDSWGITSGSERSKMMLWYALACLFIFFLAFFLGSTRLVFQMNKKAVVATDHSALDSKLFERSDYNTYPIGIPSFQGNISCHTWG